MHYFFGFFLTSRVFSIVLILSFSLFCNCLWRMSLDLPVVCRLFIEIEWHPCDSGYLCEEQKCLEQLAQGNPITRTEIEHVPNAQFPAVAIACSSSSSSSSQLSKSLLLGFFFIRGLLGFTFFFFWTTSVTGLAFAR